MIERQVDESSTVTRSARVGAALLIGALLLALVLALLPVPYVIERPGPVFDTLGSSGAEGEERPLIAIEGEETYPTAGSLDLLTVSVVGTRSQRPTWLDVLGAWGDPAQAVVPLDAVFPPGVTDEQREAQNETLMVDSQSDAIAAALIDLGYPVGQRVEIQSVVSDGPAEGVLQPGDRLVALDGDPVESLDGFRAGLATAGAGATVVVTVDRDGRTEDVSLVPEDVDGRTVIGVGALTEYDFPFEVTIQLDDVGGPSAGMMFALGIIDKLTPDELTGGRTVAGTGTITPEGVVGPIGGIRQKMFAADAAGADVFLAPESNCEEVDRGVPGDLDVYAVSTLDDALTVLETVREGGETAALPRCSAG